MKPSVNKLTLILILLLLFGNLSTSKSLLSLEEATGNKIIIVSSNEKNEKFLVNEILKYRLKFDPNLSYDIFDITKPLDMLDLIDRDDINDSYTEFMVITDHFTNFNLASELLGHLHFESFPGLIITSKLHMLDVAKLNLLGIGGCEESSLNLANNMTQFDYNNAREFSKYIQGVETTIKPWNNGSLDLNLCSVEDGAESLVDLVSVDSVRLNETVSMLFRPSNESKILISPFMINTTNSNFRASLNSISNFNTLKTKINQGLELDIFSIFSIASLLNIDSFTQPISLENLLDIETTLPITSLPSTSGNLETSGQGIPTINPDQAIFENLFAGSLVLGLLGAIIYFLNRYWLYVLGLLIGLLALFKVPSRKISVMKVYDNPTRQKILDVLSRKKGQGETVRNLAKILETPLPTLLWHFEILEDFELVIKEKVKRESVLISAEYFKEFEQTGRILKEFELTFKTDQAKNIYNYLISLDKTDTFTIGKLVSVTQYSRRTVKRYMNKLVDLKIIESKNSSSSKSKIFRISQKYFDKIKEI